MFEFLKKLLIVTTPTVVNAQASQISIVNGSYQISEHTVTGQLQINGEAKLGKNTIVKDTITINGTLKADGATFESNLFAYGTIQIKDSITKDVSYFSGNLTATNSQFVQGLTLLTDKAIFSNCKINSITVNKLGCVNTKQKIYLCMGSIVFSDITFESDDGEVHIDSTSKINGKINGGNLIQE